MSQHRHQTPLRGTKAIPRPAPGQPDYTEVNHRYAGKVGHVHEVVMIGGKQLAKVGFDDRKIVYHLLDDLELDSDAAFAAFRTGQSARSALENALRERHFDLRRRQSEAL